MLQEQIASEPAHATAPSAPRLQTPTPPEAGACRAVLRASAALLMDLPTEAFARPSHLLPGGTIGKHVRHLLDHIEAAVRAWEQPGEVLDYDHRNRDTPVESQVLAALGAIDRLDRRLARLGPDRAGQPVRVRTLLSAEGSCGEHASTAGRELAFAFHHALHHQAMIGAIAREHGVPVPSAFGKAPSTEIHEAARLVAG
ncbi:MAG: maleylpyruvate isomerase N-terminal domain-containing protein [Phycisphaerae bacterium]|nr:maleylpyruvate isomerase N-terminal domain-containing protein [Phycisphaerae bacterium]